LYYFVEVGTLPLPVSFLIRRQKVRFPQARLSKLARQLEASSCGWPSCRQYSTQWVVGMCSGGWPRI